MDSTAMAMCMDNDLPIQVLNLWQEGVLERAVQGEAVGTVIAALAGVMTCAVFHIAHILLQ